MIYLIIAGWIACAIGALGIWVAYFECEFPDADQYRENLGFGAIFCIGFGPIALLIYFGLSGFCKHGWRLTPLK